MKKTLIVTIDFPPNFGGVAAYWQNICLNLPQNKFFVLSKLPVFKYFWPRWLKGCYKIYQTYKQNACQQIWCDQVIPVGSQVYILYRLFKIPYFVQVHGKDLLMAQLNPRKYKMARRVLLNAKHVFANSRATATILANSYGVKNYTVIYPQSQLKAVAEEKICEQLRVKHQLNGKKVLLTIGRLVARKGHDQVVKALPVVLEKFPETIYVIVGAGDYEDKLKKLAEPIKNSIVFVGKVDNLPELAAWYSLCHIFVMPSREEKGDMEGFGMVYLEANSFGKPVIAGKAGGATEAVADGVSGLVVDPLDTGMLEKAIIKLLENPELATKLGQQGKARLARDFDWQKSIEIIKNRLS